MGLFDTITIHAPLPLPNPLKSLPIEWEKKEFQTKDLDNCLCEYKVTPDGKLLEKVVERVFIPHPATHPVNKTSKKIKPGWKPWAEVIEKNRYDKQLNHHGKILVYTSGEISKTEDFWIEFELYFSYGKLDKILQTNYEIQPSHNIAIKELEKRWEAEKTLPWNRFKKYANYLGWRWFWRKTAKTLQILVELLNKAQMLIYKHMT